ncbi:MAG: hypothetical protein WC378_05130 [Opitutaceae bacterium]|jgi:hypothetical protein
MSASKIERAMYGPGWVEVLFGAALSVLLGIALAFAHLVFKPVAKVLELPKETVAGQVYFIEGSTDAGKGKAWLRKRQALCESQSVELSEEEINTALATPTEKPKGGEAAAKAPASDAMLAPGALNFRIANSELQIAIPVKITLLDMTVIIQARGGFMRSGDSFRFSPETFYVGSCPFHRIPLAEGLLLKRLLASATVPEDLAGAWSKLADVKVDGKLLKLSMP